MRSSRRDILPQSLQAALPSSILYQPEHIGGSLGFGPPARLGDMWDQLEAEAEAAPGAVADLRQVLNNFLFKATPLSELVIPYNAARIYLFMQNLGTADVFVGFGRVATLLDGMRMAAAGGFFEPILGTVSSVHMIAATGTQNVVIIEGLKAA